MADDSFDYVIIGAGSAGCVLANRLSADGAARVALIEAGGGDRSIFVQMPTALRYVAHDPRFNWNYEAEPEPNLNNRRLKAPRGKLLGGSSSINAMIYLRGHPLDYDGWSEAGAPGWSFAEVLPYFKRAERRAQGGDSHRGSDGPLGLTSQPLANPLHRAFLEAGRQAGYPVTDDINGFQQEGFGRFDMTVHRGRRWSTANAYLRPALRRPNLTVIKRAQAERIVLDQGRATGVAIRQGGTSKVVAARQEVILAAGAYNSPQLLQLSGVGSGGHLRELGIPVLHDLPAVGENLQDHLLTSVQVECTQPVSLKSALHPLAQLKIGIEWILFKRGLGSSSQFESGAFIRTRAGEKIPEMQYHFLPVVIRDGGRTPLDCHGFLAQVGPQRSKSRGRIRLGSADPAAPPRIIGNYMSHPDDWREMRAGIRLAREVFAQPAFDPYRGAELRPGPGVESDEELDAFLRETVESGYHPCGSCKMGSDADAVVDPQCRVVGLQGLRVVDASVMPLIPSGNLNATTIMIAEKASDLILGRPPLAPENAPFYLPEDWQTRQRAGVAERSVV